MKNLFDSFIGSARNIRLSAAEKQQVKDLISHAIRPRMPVSDKLFAYEKALLWNSLSLVPATPADTDMTITVWHGNVFDHLQPFVLASQD